MITPASVRTCWVRLPEDQILSLSGLNCGPLLASAGIAGLAIGFGAQTLVHDVIDGVFILLEDHFDIGDTVRTASVKGTVEQMSLRRTVLRDVDGTEHIVPNSQITIVSNMTGDWSQIALRVTAAYDEPSDRIVSLLERIGEEDKAWKAVRCEPRVAWTDQAGVREQPDSHPGTGPRVCGGPVGADKLNIAPSVSPR